MATLSVAGFSTFTYSFAGGSLVFNTPFALGVLSPAHVQAYVVGELDGLGDQIYRACIYNATSGTTTVVGPLPNPCDVVLQRTVPKDVLFLSFASGADVTRTNIDVAVKYTLMALHETLDGRWSNVAFDALTDAVNDAISARDAALAAMYAAQVSQAAASASAAQSALYGRTVVRDVAAFAALTAGQLIGGRWTSQDGFVWDVSNIGPGDYTNGGWFITVVPDEHGYLALSAFPHANAAQIQVAIEAASARGLGLDWGNLALTCDSALSATLSLMRWKSDGASVTYTGAADVVSFVNIELANTVDHSLTGGGLGFDGAGKSVYSVRFVQPLGTGLGTFRAVGLKGRGARKMIGSLSAAAIYIRGGFRLVELVDPYAEDCMIRTGAGVIGSAGATGILVTEHLGVAGAYPVNTRIMRPKIRNVYSEDPTYVYDMDGIGVFASPDAHAVNGFSYCIISQPDMSGCWGRDIKTQVGHARVEDPISLVNAAPTSGKQFPVVDFQSGVGMLIGGNYMVDGVACIETAPIVRFGCSAAIGKAASLWIGGEVSAKNGGTMQTVVRQDVVAPLAKVSAKCVGQTVNLTPREFALVRTNGADKDFLSVEGLVIAGLDDALCRVVAGSGGAAPYRAHVRAAHVVNLGAEKPTVRHNVVGSGAVAVLDEVACRGLGPKMSAYLGNGATLSGCSLAEEYTAPRMSDGGGPASGGTREIAVVLANNAQYIVPSHGMYGAFRAEIRVGVNDRFASAVISFDNGGIVQEAVGASWGVGTTAEPATGSYRMWRDVNNLVIKNVQGSTRTFMLRLFG